uniref:RNase H domain-containing protein n=1 Tax=Loa loa TaxID=7209 RepID=A0A1I7V740_LOALO
MEETHRGMASKCYRSTKICGRASRTSRISRIHRCFHGSLFCSSLHAEPQKWNSAKSFLFYAKSRIAPIKGITIPKLELLSVLIGVRAAQFVVKQLNIISYHVTVWSDSKCALFWITNYTKLPPRFIQNRIEEIRNSKYEVRYTPGEHNPADIATGGLAPIKHRKSEQWWKGPRWLEKERSEWPKSEFHYEESDEFQQTIIAKITEANFNSSNNSPTLLIIRYNLLTQTALVNG